MKCIIRIDGQLHGNFTLFKKLRNSIAHSKLFNGQEMILNYNTISGARKDLKEAYKELQEEEPDYNGIYLYNDTLYYDASKAKIVK